MTNKVRGKKNANDYDKRELHHEKVITMLNVAEITAMDC